MAIVAQATQDRARLGIVMTLGAYAFFTLIGTSVKWLVLVVIRPFETAFHWIALLNGYNAFAPALYSIITRKISGFVAAETMQFYMGAFGAITLFPFAFWVWTPPASMLDWVLMVSLGVWGWAGHEIFSRAHGFAAANTSLPYTYSFLLYLALASYLVFNDVPDQWTLPGAGIIVVSGLIIWRRIATAEAV